MGQEPSRSFGSNLIFDAIVQSTQDAPVVQNVAESVQPVVQRALRSSGALADMLHGVWVGHPLHPVVTDVPIGAWTMAAIFDVLSLSGRREFEAAADVSVNVGIAGALVAALSGLADWGETSGRPARVGVVHAASNSLALALYATSAVTRRRSRGLGIVTSFAGLLCAGIGAGLGGHLVYGEQQGVNHAAADALPLEWTRLFPLDELLEDTPHKADIGGIALAVIKQKGNVYALLDRCSHLGGPLSQGSVGDCSITCPWHGSTFALTNGSVQRGPATLSQPTFETRIVDGFVEVRAFSKEAP